MIVHNREHLKKKTIRYEIFLMKYTILYIESLYQKKKSNLNLVKSLSISQ